jgi:glycerol-3-phosphate dehydrogenase
VNRKESIRALQETKQWDLIVIGGGATGLGIAVDASKRGYKCLLLEKNDFAKGTSSRSTKLVHGGVRYLAQGNIKLVVEALRERSYLLSNAPHLTRIQPFIIPVYSYFLKWFYGIGLMVYDLLAARRSVGKTNWLSKSTVLNAMPSIRKIGLKGGIRYSDGQFDDARLAIALAMTAHDQGATVLNYASVISLKKEKGKVVGVEAELELEGTRVVIAAKSVINATGVFVDAILDMDDPASPAMVMPSQGVHLVIDKKFFPGAHALMIPKTRDGRVLFALPWQEHVVIGTTDTPLDSISEEPVALEEEIEFIISHFNEYNEKRIDRKDVLSVYAGLRPLVKSTNADNTALASRDHTIMVSPSGLVTITGGKWTTYRKMANDAVNNAAFISKLPAVKCSTKNLRLHGYTSTVRYGDFLSSYGADADIIQQWMQEDPMLSVKVHPNHEYRRAEVVWSVKMEMAMTVEDILARRCRMLLLDARAALEAAPIVARIMAPLLDKDKDWEEEQVTQFRELATQYLIHVSE